MTYLTASFFKLSALQINAYDAFQLLNSEVRKQLFINAQNIQRIRDIGKQMIMNRTSNGQFGLVDDILDSIISELLNDQFLM